MLQNISTSDKSIYQRILKNKTVSTKIRSSTTVFFDWSNDAENTAWITRINDTLKMLYNRKQKF